MKILKSLDLYLFAPILFLMLAGLVTVSGYGFSQSFFGEQVTFIIIAILLMVFISSADVKLLRESKTAFLLYMLSIVLLTLVLFLGKEVNGARSWFSFGSFTFQPVDIAKISLLILLAKYLARRHMELANLKHLLISGFYAIIPVVLVARQPDFGSAIVILTLWFVLSVLSGIPKKQILAIVFLAIASCTALWFFGFEDYQRDRIRSFLNPLSDITGTGYNAFQSVVAVGSGGFIGKGVGEGTQSRLSFLPEYETDFVFAAFSEEWGFIGSFLVIFSIVLIIWRLSIYAMRGSSNFETLFCAGLAIIIFVHGAINIGMNIGLLPVTGLTLPFMSAGGSHLIAEAVGIGIAMSMNSYSRPAHKELSDRELLGSV